MKERDTMRRLLIWGLALLMLCGTAAADYTPPDGIPWERYNVGDGSFARWSDAGLDEALRILDALDIDLYWPGVFPEGFDPEAEPYVIIDAVRSPQGYHDFRVGGMLHSEQNDGALYEYWQLDPAAFARPDRIDFVFYNEARDSHFVVIYHLRTQKWLFGEYRMYLRQQSLEEAKLDNGMICYNTFDFADTIHWRKIHLCQETDYRHYEDNPTDDDRLVVAYEVRSTAMDLEPLMEVAQGLVLVEEGP